MMCRSCERAAYKEWVDDLSSKPDRSAKLLQKGVISDALRDRRRGCRAAESPGCCPLPGSARAFPGRRPRAGIARRRSAPACRREARAPDRWSFPPARHWLGSCGCGIGEQLATRAGCGGAVWAGGVVGAGGACALAIPGTTISRHERKSDWFIRMGRKRPARAGVPRKSTARFTICENGSAKNAPSAASGGARPG